MGILRDWYEDRRDDLEDFLFELWGVLAIGFLVFLAEEYKRSRREIQDLEMDRDIKDLLS